MKYGFLLSVVLFMSSCGGSDSETTNNHQFVGVWETTCYDGIIDRFAISRDFLISELEIYLDDECVTLVEKLSERATYQLGATVNTENGEEATRIDIVWDSDSENTRNLIIYRELDVLYFGTFQADDDQPNSLSYDFEYIRQ